MRIYNNDINSRRIYFSAGMDVSKIRWNKVKWQAVADEFEKITESDTFHKMILEEGRIDIYKRGKRSGFRCVNSTSGIDIQEYLSPNAIDTAKNFKKYMEDSMFWSDVWQTGINRPEYGYPWDKFVERAKELAK